MPSIRYRGWGDGVARIPAFSFFGYLAAIVVGLAVGTMTVFVLDALGAPDTGHVTTTRQMLDGFFEVVRFTVVFTAIATVPTALVGSIILVPAIVWAGRAGIRSGWATAVSGALATAMLLLLPSLVIGASSDAPMALLVPFAFMPAGAMAALTYRSVVLHRFAGGERFEPIS